MKIFRQPLFVPSGKNFGSAPYMGIPSRNASSFSRLVVLKGTRCARSGSMINERMRSISLGRSSSLSLSGRTERSRGEMQKKALPRMTRDNAGQKIEVIIDDARQNRLRSHVDQPGPRLTQQQ